MSGTRILLWVVLDSREHGKPFLPYVLVTLVLGAAGPLLYLVRRDRNAA